MINHDWNYTYFDRAIKESKKSTHHSFQMGAVIVNKGKIMSCGHNQLKTHPLSMHKYKQIHAEFHALISFKGESVARYDIYVARVNGNNEYVLAKPCVSCMNMIMTSELNRLYYTTDTGYECIDIRSNK